MSGPQRKGGLLSQDEVPCSVPVHLFLVLLVISKGFQRWCLAQSGHSLTHLEDSLEHDCLPNTLLSAPSPCVASFNHPNTADG